MRQNLISMKTISMVTAFLTLLVISCAGQKTTEIFTESSLAIRGYDPVSYFTDSAAVKGNKEFSYNWKDATWLFSSKKNHDLFVANPEKYAPQYGGWCAYGCSDKEGHKSPTDPNAWTIVGGKLYFNYSLKVKEFWMKEQKQRIEQADKNWPAIKDN